jgi:hypothetical protein
LEFYKPIENNYPNFGSLSNLLYTRYFTSALVLQDERKPKARVVKLCPAQHPTNPTKSPFRQKKAAQRTKRKSVRSATADKLQQALNSSTNAGYRFFLRQNENNGCLSMTKKASAFFASFVSLCETNPL